MSRACQQHPPTNPELLPLITTGFYIAPPQGSRKAQSKHRKDHSSPTICCVTSLDVIAHFWMRGHSAPTVCNMFCKRTYRCFHFLVIYITVFGSVVLNNEIVKKFCNVSLCSGWAAHPLKDRVRYLLCSELTVLPSEPSLHCTVLTYGTGYLHQSTRTIFEDMHKRCPKSCLPKR